MQSNMHSQQAHLQPRWHMWKACKAQMGTGCSEGNYESTERRRGSVKRRGKTFLKREYARESVSVACQWWMCLGSPESSSLLSDTPDSLELSSHTKAQYQLQEGEQGSISTINKTRSHSVEMPTGYICTVTRVVLQYVLYFLEQGSLLSYSFWSYAFCATNVFLCSVEFCEGLKKDRVGKIWDKFVIWDFTLYTVQ